MIFEKKPICIIIVVILLVSLIGISYAFFQINNPLGNVNNTTNIGTISKSNIAVNFNVIFDQNNAKIETKTLAIASTYSNIIKFKVTTNFNNGNLKYEINWNLVKSTLINADTNYNLYSCSTDTNYINATLANVATNCTQISPTSNNTLPKTNSTARLHTSSYLTINADTTHYYVLTYSIGTNNNGNFFEGVINVKEYKTIKQVLLEDNKVYPDNISSTYVSSNTGIDFTDVNSPTNGQGLYTNVKNSQNTLVRYFRGGTYCTYDGYASEDDTGTNCLTAGGTWTDYHCSLSDSKSACETAGGTYYELKNNVMFAGFAWKIIRINEDGSIRMIFNGTSPYDRGSNITINDLTNYAYNSTTSYDTGDGPSNSSENTSALEYASYANGSIKSTIEDWYLINLSEYSSYIADTDFCSDLTHTTGTTWDFGSLTRITSGNPTFNCPTTDIYTVANSKLANPIATITNDEVIYGGNRFNDDITNYTNYLQAGRTIFTMTPSTWESTGEVSAFSYNYRGNSLSSYVNNTAGARPVINLSSNVMISSGNGTLDNPYIITSDNEEEQSLPPVSGGDGTYVCATNWTLENEGEYLNYCYQPATCTTGTLSGNSCYINGTYNARYCCDDACYTTSGTCSSSTTYAATLSCPSGWSTYNCNNGTCCSKASTCSSGTKKNLGNYVCTTSFSTYNACSANCASGDCTSDGGSTYYCIKGNPNCSIGSLSGNQYYCLTYGNLIQSCASGDALSGSTCTHTTTTSRTNESYYSCDAGWTKSGTQCYKSATCTYGTINSGNCYTLDDAIRSQT